METPYQALHLISRKNLEFQQPSQKQVNQKQLPQLKENILLPSFKLKQNFKPKLLDKQKSKECQGRTHSIYSQARHLFKLFIWIL